MARSRPRRAHQRPRRFELRCRLCGATWPDATTLGELQREHFMRMHDRADVALELVDTWTGRAREVLN